MANSKRHVGFDWDLLENMLAAPRGVPPPPKSITIEQFATKRKMSYPGASNALKKLARSGIMDTDQFWDEERGRRVRFYWLVEKK